MPEWNDLVGTLGPSGALLVWMIWQSRQNAPPKADPLKELNDTINAIDKRMIRVETILEKMSKDE